MAQIDKPNLHFNTKLYTGNGSTQSITGVGFQPDWVWGKNRSATGSHNLCDAVRGATKIIYANLTDAESTDSNSFTSFDSDGFSIGSQSNINANGNNIATWNWKAGTTGSGTTGGAGTAKDYQYSVNTTAGFSIIKYKGNGTAGHTIPHHLGAVPKVIIVKCIESVHNWQVLHQGLASNSGTKNLELNSTSGVLTDSTTWNDTAPTSTVFTLGSTNPTNQSSSNFNFIAYCFAEKPGYSKFGKYTGNGADGSTTNNFIYTGFKPAWVMVKRYNDSGQQWSICDSVRSPTNVSSSMEWLFPDANGVETQEDLPFLLSNGFMPRTGHVYMNRSGFQYIYMAFAENPLVGSNNIPAVGR